MVTLLKAAVLYGPWRVEVADLEKPMLPRGWVLVKTELVGICGTDKAFYTGRYRLFKTPLVPGHEVVGIVVDGEGELVGKRVVSEINFSCGECEYCKTSLYTHCPGKKTLGIDFDGGMAEYFVAPAKALHVFPDTPEIGIFVEPLAAVLRAFSVRPLPRNAKVAVIGTGNLAWLTVQVLKKLYDVKVDLVARRESVKAKYYSNLVDDFAYFDEPPRSVYDAVFEGSGDPGALNTAVRIVKPRGLIYLKSTPGVRAEVDTTLAVVKEVEVVCSRCGTRSEFRTAIELLTKKVVSPRLDRIHPLHDVDKAFEESLKPNYFKIAIRPSDN